MFAEKHSIIERPKDADVEFRIVTATTTSQLLSGFTIQRPAGTMVGSVYKQGTANLDRGGIQVTASGRTRILMIDQQRAAEILHQGCPTGRALLSRLQLECELNDVIDKFVAFQPLHPKS